LLTGGNFAFKWAPSQNNTGSCRPCRAATGPPPSSEQYHFLPGAQIDPYVGAGINYTLISKVDILNGDGRLEHDSVGAALQAGVDFRIDSRWSVDLDVKKVQIRSDVDINGAHASRVKVDPLLLGVGVGYRF